MKLLQVNTTLSTGSTGRITERIGSVAIKNQIESYIGFGRGEVTKSKSNAIAIGGKLDMLWHAFETMVFDRHGLASRLATNRFVKQLNFINPDVIHLHNIHGYYLNIDIFFKWLIEVKKPVVWTLHDSWPFTGHCTYFDNIGCERWKTACHNCPKKNKYPSSYGFDRSAKNFTQKRELFSALEKLTIVTPSQWLANLVGQSFLNQSQTKVIYNGVDTSLFAIKSTNASLLESQGAANKRILLGVASIWDKRKGLEDFIKLSRIIDKDYLIVLIGLNKKQLRHLPDNIVGISRTENIESLVDWYNAADVFINPTWQDNFPTTNIEALACGTPVVTYKTGGSPEALDNYTGRVVEKGDVRGIWEAIQHLSQNLENFQNKCRERALQSFSDKDRYLEYIELYKQLSLQ